MATQTEGTFEVDGHKLHSTTWTPEGPIKAKLVFVHGFSDHVGRYDELFPNLAGRGIQVFSWDQRGWGRSAASKSDRGLTGPTSRVLADVAAFIKSKIPSPPTDAPLFVMGHSMGGGQVLALASDPQYHDLVGQVRGWLLESPFIAFTPGEEPSFLKVFFGKLASKVLPKQQLVNEIPAEHLTRDKAAQQSIRDDDLMHNTGTLEGLAGMLERTDQLAQNKLTLSGNVKSLWLGHGTEDKTTCFNASKKWFGAQTTIEDGHHKPYEGAYHQLHADLCKDEFFKDVGDWILERAGEPAAAKPESKL
ncbi:hydrolase [Colletotrichum abscissum]|uniref:Hydrolase n=2 Tax=Colletotrichum acutatum species complex TaxID=2707335 RepID=A0A9P9X4W6_9PEZI|nr:hydrolase [Colletotrichum costaricense]XP_060397986.1 hydrolase [Colletotrichum abscissum]KAI3543941.1 hydrolase [Colletotrichum filicis]KAI3536546.1 hydrolase [Colletotrichum abscissum]KAK1495610.1 hydrolase [Colletotrichum abscissum]KAK1526206.1 hydrolase [Colletotrichum costaricense]